MYNYNKLKGLIREKYITNANFANKIGISLTSLSNKLNNKVAWSQPEIYASKIALDLTEKEIDEIFFTK